MFEPSRKLFLFLKMGYPQPLFRLFKQTLQFLQQFLWKLSIQYTVLGFEPTTFRLQVLSLNHKTCGQSYKHFTLVNYDSRVVPDWKIPHIMTYYVYKNGHRGLFSLHRVICANKQLLLSVRERAIYLSRPRLLLLFLLLSSKKWLMSTQFLTDGLTTTTTTLANNVETTIEPNDARNCAN